MCAIAGLFSPGQLPEQAGEWLKDALGRMGHRGPDHTGITMLDGVCLGHNRLSILDLSEAAHQPMSDPDKSSWIVFNGEIFNYTTLAQQLREEGVRLLTRSDTEVLMHWLSRRGARGLNDINGFFALALWDSRKKELLLARDRFGEKPLWLAENNDQLAFASTTRGLHSLMPHQGIDGTALAHFMALSYVPSWTGFLRGYRKLPAGHYLTISAQGRNEQRYYQPSPVRLAEDPAAGLHTRLSAAVQDRLVADVPLGAFLSGGVDSAITCALAIRHHSRLRTFSARFPDHPYLDESAQAAETAKHIGSIHETLEIRESDMLRNLDGVVDAMDEPFADSSAIALYTLSRHVRRHVTIALSGDGADELFGGYRKHLALVWMLSAGPGQKALAAGAARLTTGMPSGRQSRLADLVRRIQRLHRVMGLEPGDRYRALTAFAQPEHVDAILPGEYVRQATEDMRAMLSGFDFTALDGILRADQALVLPSDMLVKVDSMSMAHALEIRPPFLDHRVVEWANALGPEWKIRSGQGKFILRQAFLDYLPAATFKRRKRGFEVPMESWLRGPLMEEVRELHASSRLRDAGLHLPAVHHLTHRFLQGDGSCTAITLHLWTLNRWLTRHFA